MRRGDFHPRPKARAVQGGIKAQSTAGSFGQNWWAKRWLAVLESFRFGARLARGRIYARDGQAKSQSPIFLSTHSPLRLNRVSWSAR
jgi:hypothetical protein